MLRAAIHSLKIETASSYKEKAAIKQCGNYNGIIKCSFPFNAVTFSLLPLEISDENAGRSVSRYAIIKLEIWLLQPAKAFRAQ
jgi:hypothetical protein